MAILDDRLRRQLQDRFRERLKDSVRLTLFTRPGTGRLILPGGLGCPTCDDARQLAEDVSAAAPELIQLEVIDVRERESEVQEVPTLALGPPDQAPRIRWQGLTSGFEFATVVDALERVSTAEHGLSATTLVALGGLDQPLEVMVFATPT